MQRPRGATRGQLTDHHSTAFSDTIPTPTDSHEPQRLRVRDVTNLPPGTHRVRVPASLLISRRHSHTAVLLYAVADLLAAGPAGDPVDADPPAPMAGAWPQRRTPDGAGREIASRRLWLARRVGLASHSGLDDALAALGTVYDGDGLGQRHPAYLATRRYGRRGGGSIAVRTVTACSRYTQVPAWTTGDATGPLVDAAAWRLYVAAVAHRDRSGVCRVSAGELAEVIGVRRQAIAELLVRLRHAGLVVTVAAPGKPTLILPLLVRVDAVDDRAALADEVAVACGYLPPGWRQGWSSHRGSPGPSTGVQGGPQTGVSQETDLGRHTSRDSTRGRPPQRPRLAEARPGWRVPAPRPPAPPNDAYRQARHDQAVRRAAARAAHEAAQAEHAAGLRARLNALIPGPAPHDLPPAAGLPAAG